MTEDTRIPPALTGDERTTLNNWLEWHRATLAFKCAGLSDDQLRLRSASPSTLSLLGLVRHMAHVERSWFRRVLNGEDLPKLWDKDRDNDADFKEVDTASVKEAFATWEEEIERARAISAAKPLEAVGDRNGQACTHRYILIHMVEEYARHNGHADLLRERIDGAIGD
ncbi:DinB family protein [Nonomuraea sp. NPDC050153]|uniref:DinB family protein n=1 Tax=Nonomuraea sp. NPDC050153 TaxID=3364359 RepID=UPI0037B27625